MSQSKKNLRLVLMKMLCRVKSKVLGHGVNGKVKQCVNKAGQKFALKVDKRSEDDFFQNRYWVCLSKDYQVICRPLVTRQFWEARKCFLCMELPPCLISQVMTKDLFGTDCTFCRIVTNVLFQQIIGENQTVKVKVKMRFLLLR